MSEYIEGGICPKCLSTPHNPSCEWRQDRLLARIAELENSEVYKLKTNLNEVLANEAALIKLVENRDQSAFVFTSRLKALCDEFDERISLAAAIGAMEVVKHELIAGALEDE